ncbi:unnamed protein product [Tetraodon nigroviridis]|uniref:(spotted green pufferfish) hypothetical protein n=1 Tax=Tetraodon nigroviridis TaxID=99883 RepID=Q4RKR1_TETNG|nr:unnamed protein product [Tetraodon nigroviridis]
MLSATRPAGFVSSKERFFKVVDRPLLAHGLPGIPIPPPRNPRKKGKTYYLGLVMQKNEEITAEIKKLENQIKKSSTSEADFLLIVEENKALDQNIKDLEGQIADYQLLATTFQHQMDAKLLCNKYMILRDKNDKKTEQNNNIFMKRAEVEESINKLQRKNDAIKETMESMCPAKQKEYFAMITANKELLKKMDILQEEMNLLVERKEDYELAVSYSEDKSEMLMLHKELAAKQEVLRAMRTAPEPQGYKHFQEKMEKDSKELASIEKQLADLRGKEKELAERIHQAQDSRAEYEKLKRSEEKLDRLLASLEKRKAVKLDGFPHAPESHPRNPSLDSQTAQTLEKMLQLLVNGPAKAAQGLGSAGAPEMKLLCHDLKRMRSDQTGLKELMGSVASQLATHRTPRRSADRSQKRLQEERERLSQQQWHLRQALEDLDQEYHDLRKELSEMGEKGRTLRILSQLSKLGPGRERKRERERERGRESESERGRGRERGR